MNIYGDKVRTRKKRAFKTKRRCAAGTSSCRYERGEKMKEDNNMSLDAVKKLVKVGKAQNYLKSSEIQDALSELDITPDQ